MQVKRQLAASEEGDGAGEEEEDEAMQEADAGQLLRQALGRRDGKALRRLARAALLDPTDQEGKELVRALLTELGVSGRS